MSPFWWLAVAALMAAAEFFMQGLITIWFVVGGIAAFVASYLGFDPAGQIIIFIGVSLVCLLVLRPMVVKHRKIGEAHEPTQIGLHGVVVERIDAEAHTGRIETPDHMTWAAISNDGEPIEVGEQVHVVDQQSVKLVVEWVFLDEASTAKPAELDGAPQTGEEGRASVPVSAEPGASSSAAVGPEGEQPIAGPAELDDAPQAGVSSEGTHSSDSAELGDVLPIVGDSRGNSEDEQPTESTRSE